MTTIELTRAIFRRLNKFRYLIIAAGLILGGLLGYYAMKTPIKLTSKASVFPLNSTNERSSSSYLSALLGASESSKSFSDDASINIVELALSRNTSEAVAATRVPSMGNKLIAELVIEDFNNHLGLLEKKIEIPRDPERLIITGGVMLKAGLGAALNKTSTLIINYTGRGEEFIKVVSYQFLEKISQFYIELKKEKAQRDYIFATNKVDSLRRVMNAKDYQLIAMDKRTLFTDRTKLEYKVPSENLMAEKQLVRNQFMQAVGNQQNAAYTLQKSTPIIKTLDQPLPPYTETKKKPSMYFIIGFVAGVIMLSGLCIVGLIISFAKAEASKAIFGSSVQKNTTTTASVA